MPSIVAGQRDWRWVTVSSATSLEDKKSASEHQRLVIEAQMAILKEKKYLVFLKGLPLRLPTYLPTPT